MVKLRFMLILKFLEEKVFASRSNENYAVKPIPRHFPSL